MNVYRFDLVGLTPEEVTELKTRLEMVAFLIKEDPLGRFLDLYAEHEIDLASLIRGCNRIKYADYSNVPTELWKYPFP